MLDLPNHCSHYVGQVLMLKQVARTQNIVVNRQLSVYNQRKEKIYFSNLKLVVFLCCPFQMFTQKIIFKLLLSHATSISKIHFLIALILQWQWSVNNNMSRVVKKPAFCICENKDADQLRGNREADQRLCFRYTESTTPLLPKYEISSL